MRRRRNTLAITLIALIALIGAPAQASEVDDPTTFAAARDAVARARERSATSRRAKNVILFLGDGMGISTVTAARIFDGQQRGQTGEENHLVFEDFPHVGLVKTYNTNQQTPDSAGTMTAIVTGTKTRAGVISVDRKVPLGDFAGTAGNELRTIVERAEARGLATGLVTTTTVTHATPAALYAHSPDRGWQSDDALPPEARAADFPDIARQLIEFPFGDGPEVVLGGGRRHFQPSALADPEFPEKTGRRLDDRNLTAEWTSSREKAAYVWNREQLLATDPAEVDHLLGLFDPSHMHFEIDRRWDEAGEPSLSEMTTVAIAILQRNPKGFFLMVEGGRIDHAHHSGNAFRALSDTVEFANAVRVALEATKHGDTLVVVTADHDHVFNMAGYPTRGNDILGKVVSNDERGEAAERYSLDSRGRPYTTLGYQNGPGASSAVLERGAGPIHQRPEDFGTRGEAQGRPDLTHVNTADPDFLQEAAIPFHYETHGGEDVAVYATGPGADLFNGVREQHYLYHAMVEALGWNRRGFFDRILR
jgi:alkaline phosphatase